MVKREVAPQLAKDSTDFLSAGPSCLYEYLLHKTSLWIAKVTGSREMFGGVGTPAAAR